MCDHAIIVGKECDFEEEKELSFPQLARFVFSTLFWKFSRSTKTVQSCSQIWYSSGPISVNKKNDYGSLFHQYGFFRKF